MWLFVLKYWKHILIPTTILGLFIGVYLKGRSDGAAAIVARTEAEYQRKIQEYLDQVSKGTKKADEIRDYRNNNKNDEVDSCILSDNPIKSRCIQ